MREVTQSILMDGIPEGGAEEAVEDGVAAGDCVRACVASILEYDLEDVPHFVQYREHPEGTDPNLWLWALIGFCAYQDWRVEHCDIPPKGWSIAGGKSPRGHQHAVVAYDGEIVWDPHPSRSGLTDIEAGWLRLSHDL